MQLPAHELPAFIVECLQQGFEQKAIADALGCSESYVSQLIAARPELRQAKQQLSDRYADTDALYDKIEQEALKQLEMRLATCTKPMELVRIAQAMNAAKRRSLPVEVGAGAGAGTVVHVTIPQQVAVQQFQFNAHNQAIALTATDGKQERALITASTEQLDRLAAAVAAAKTNQKAVANPVDEM